ncbi:MAG TPA: diacylglycerol kinase family protein [Propionibacteriaceae bacterium]|nr:diacylglycerol kinase family protein [Propionibacteriaceae bacterium]
MDSILLLTNGQAGSADDEKLDVAVAALRISATVEVRVTSRQAELDAVLDHLERRQLVVAGGDGSFHGVVAALNRRNELGQTVLGLIPLGTGNDFARAVGIPLDPEAAARAVLAGKVGPIDLVVDDAGDVVVNNVRVGMGADASRQAIKWKERLGRLGYAVGAAKAALRPNVLRVLILVDEELVADVDRAVLDISVGNGATVGGGLTVNPSADPQSGQMDVMLSFAVGPVARIGYGIDLLRCRHLTRRDVLHRRGNTVSISGTAFYPSSDGEVSGPVSNRTWRVLKSAFQMTLP